MTLVIVAFFMVVSLSIAVFAIMEREQRRDHELVLNTSRKNGFARV